MNKILNPFEYLSTGKALGWGLAGTLFSICLLTAVSWPDRKSTRLNSSHPK